MNRALNITNWNNGSHAYIFYFHFYKLKSYKFCIYSKTVVSLSWQKGILPLATTIVNFGTAQSLLQKYLQIVRQSLQDKDHRISPIEWPSKLQCLDKWCLDMLLKHSINLVRLWNKKLCFLCKMIIKMEKFTKWIKLLLCINNYVFKITWIIKD